jgi:hypothetical protein
MNIRAARPGRRPAAEDRDLWAAVTAYVEELSRRAATHTVGSVTPLHLERRFGVSRHVATKLLERVAKTYPSEWTAERSRSEPWPPPPSRADEIGVDKP